MIILFLTNFQFENPWFLALLLLLPIVLLRYIKSEKEPILSPENVETSVCPDFGGFKLSKTPKYFIIVV